MRGIFFDEGDARAVVARLVSAGYDAHAARERLAGEDDDEDHPWAVLTDAPEIVLDMLVDEYDGWLDADEPDVGEESFRRPRPRHHEVHVVEGWAEIVGAPHARTDAVDGCPQRFEEQCEQSVELVAEPAAPPAHDLVEQRRLVERYRHPEVDVEVLERHALEVAPLQLRQRRRAVGAEPAEVLVLRDARITNAGSTTVGADERDAGGHGQQ